MNFSFETMLMLGILGFYIYDSTLLLFSSELVFVESFGKWSVSIPNERWRLMGKFLFLPNPFSAINLIFITEWLGDDSSFNHEMKDINKLKASVRHLRISVIILMILFFIILPLVLFKLGIGNAALVVISCIYLAIINMLCYTYIKRADLGINGKKFAALAFETISCPPFALNFIRRISLLNIVCKKPIKFAAKNLEAEAYKEFIENLSEKLNEELEFEDDESSSRSVELITFRDKLLGSLK